jgi:hypothetical protein
MTYLDKHVQHVPHREMPISTRGWSRRGTFRWRLGLSCRTCWGALMSLYVNDRKNLGYPTDSGPTLSLTNSAGHESVTLALHTQSQ